MREHIRKVAIILLCVAVFISGFQLYDIYKDKRESQDIFDDLAKQITEDEEPKATGEVTVNAAAERQKEVLEKYKNIAKTNADFVGWISIDGTSINYPVMQTVDRPDYYLKRDFNGNYNRHGVPYAAETCNVLEPSDNITIYGHHMNDGTMFSDLDKYKEESYYKAHKMIHFNTLKSCNDYQVIAAFKTVAYSNKGFPYFEFHDAASEQEFTDYVSEVKARAFYDTGESASYGDKLITLSTCEYTQTNGRVVVVAKRINK